VRLLQRTTRTVRTTTEGRDLYASVAPAVSTLSNAARSLEPATRKPKGRLRVTAPNDLSSAFLADVIAAFTERYPLVQLDFALTNQHSNLVGEGFDVALRATENLRDFGASLYIVYPSIRNVPARVSAFRDFVIEAFDAWSARR
jgi:DNA-binding transcriptional LysR family regulator